MGQINVRDLRNRFSPVSDWIEQGETVEILKRGRPFAHLMPVREVKRREFQVPDFRNRLETAYPHPRLEAEESARLREDLRGER